MTNLVFSKTASGYMISYNRDHCIEHLNIAAADIPELSEKAFSALCDMSAERMAEPEVAPSCQCNLGKHSPICGLRFRKDRSIGEYDFCGRSVSEYGVCGHNKACHTPPQGAKP